MSWVAGVWLFIWLAKLAGWISAGCLSGCWLWVSGYLVILLSGWEDGKLIS